MTRSITSQALRVSLFILVLFVLPTAARAAVVISEVMYNPAGTDTGREWVELYNSGDSDVTLVGGSGKNSWRISDSSNHTITDPQGGVGRGSLTIPAQGYLILTSDPTVFMGEYSGSYSVAKASLSLTNTGATISLIDGAGATVDSVAYVASQGGQDDGTSLQQASSTWLQALPTPGAQNATQSYEPPADTSTATDSSSSSSKSSSAYHPGYVTPPLPDMFADAGEDRTVVVGADTKFVALAYDRDKNVIYYAKFHWNFGDGSTAEGPWVLHHYSYPGQYAVELTVTNTRLTTTSHMKVTAEPASLQLMLLPQGGISIQNKSGRDLDLSFWLVKQGDDTFKLPEHSVVLKDGAINISAATLGFMANSAKLYYPDSTEVVSSLAPAPEPVPPPAAAPAEQFPVQDAPVIVSVAHTQKQKPADLGPQVSSASEASSTSAATEAPQVPAAPELEASVAASEAALPLWTALAGLGGIVGLGVASVYAVRRRPVTGTGAEEFTIE